MPAAPSPAPPSWIQDAVFYQIFPDRFARSPRVDKPGRLEPWHSPPTAHGYKGGDLLGVAERLDYLLELGVNALYLNPVFQSASNHRYHTHDYLRVDPLLGGDAALAELLEQAHARGMRVILDGVFNHASRGFFQFSDILENGQHSPYLDWFHVRRFPLNAYGGGRLGYDAWWDLPALPKFNTANPEVREFLLGVAEHWLRFGIDGWRLDVPNEIDDDEFWREFRRRCKAVRPDCYLVGEIWGDASRWLQGDQFDAVMNYPLTRAILGFVARSVDHAEVARSGYRELPPLDAGDFAVELQELLSRHAPEVTAAQLNLLGSHDTPRVMTVLQRDEAAVRMAFALLLTLPGVPCIYYGDELGLIGGHDPGCRQGMPWDQPEERHRGIREEVRYLASLRHRHAALRRGELRPLLAQGQLLAYARQHGDDRALVLVNAGERQLPLDAPVEGSALEGEYLDPRSGLRLTLQGGRIRGLDVPPRRALVYLPSGEAAGRMPG